MTDASARVHTRELIVRTASGALVENHVEVEQLTHATRFGNLGFEPFDDASAKAWLALFNQATMAFYWRTFEGREGEPDTERTLATAEWFRSHGVRLKGHPLLWHTLAPQWLMGRSHAEVELAIRDRITRDVAQFAGVVDEWDAVNEAVIMPRFTAEANAISPLAAAMGRVEVIRLAFDTARAANPSAKLVLNDFLLTDEYAALIARCLDEGIQIDAIGLQTHMHQGFRGERDLSAILEKFGQFGLPLQLTETTLVSGELMPADIDDLNDHQVESWPSTAEGEARQADEIVRHYRTCMAHPLVESVTYWGFSDRHTWLGAPAGLLRHDGSQKPAYQALSNLLKGEWWRPRHEVAVRTSGTVTISGWEGDYRVSANGESAIVHLEPGSTPIEITLA